MPRETHPFDAAEYLTCPKAQAELLEEAKASGEKVFIENAKATVRRAIALRGKQKG